MRMSFLIRFKLLIAAALLLILPDGTNIEGRGVVPDLFVPLRPEDLLRGIDSQLNAAIGQLSSH